ncbi:MFS transporter [Pigmentiphaga litoralis]|uniref:Bug family tripartite tricarboxylate transporter substrate binding protein n=1 Tax=Pigmentiphaga litoralis TaxID=516702 RepID=UPI00167367C5|nr:tripartite tricarboxylate transporter substrate binding protein [Pigmentiphaga litoralis]GGX23910.1 MFS transporter [Pigmentiphaga litoralis]
MKKTALRRPLSAASFATAFATSLAALLSLTAPAHAADYPVKPVRIVVAYPAGGDTDVIARWIAEKLAAKWGQPVVVENRTGAAGSIGSAYVARTPADGYTLLVAPNTLAIAPYVLKPGSGGEYNAKTDFTAISEIGRQSLFMVGADHAGLKSVDQVVKEARAGKVTSYASPGSGSPMHILSELFDRSAGIKLTQIPYRGSAPAIVDLVGGQVPVMYSTIGPLAQYVATGKLRLLGVADKVRSPFAPDVPTFAELGYKDVEVSAWQAVFGPRGLPPEIVQKVNLAVNDILKMPDVVDRMKALAISPTGGTPEQMGAVIAAEDARYSKIIKDFGIRAD